MYRKLVYTTLRVKPKSNLFSFRADYIASILKKLHLFLLKRFLPSARSYIFLISFKINKIGLPNQHMQKSFQHIGKI
ncbi:hypothetical protein BpHYR1_024743 [Brachionus plicatilis]|uniref:Uncharacterized protein n=1 Tax=Brachionus plicatilis TaxID=10195 RepID=A0A3M7P927_BRAPC|nr:hypothetical protein BpHYR1_024743 [Brachionus plicatilis]